MSADDFNGGMMFWRHRDIHGWRLYHFWIIRLNKSRRLYTLNRFSIRSLLMHPASQAEAAKAEIARGQAQANDLLTKSLSPQLMQWKQLEILDSKWNGQFPQVVGSGTMPLKQLGK